MAAPEIKQRATMRMSEAVFATVSRESLEGKEYAVDISDDEVFSVVRRRVLYASVQTRRHHRRLRSGNIPRLLCRRDWDSLNFYLYRGRRPPWIAISSSL